LISLFFKIQEPGQQNKRHNDNYMIHHRNLTTV
jgi:hypothetical protein